MYGKVGNSIIYQKHVNVCQTWDFFWSDMGVSKSRGTPKSSILIGLSTISNPFFEVPLFLQTAMYIYIYVNITIILCIYNCILDTTKREYS